MPALDLVVFDIAGTIIEDTGQVINAFTAAFRKHAIRVTDAEIRTLHGASKREVFKHYIERQFGPENPENTGRIDRAYVDFRDLLETTYAKEGVQAIPGVESTFGDGTLVLGTWQQIFHLQCDIKPRRRSVMVTVMGE